MTKLEAAICRWTVATVQCRLVRPLCALSTRPADAYRSLFNSGFLFFKVSVFDQSIFSLRMPDKRSSLVPHFQRKTISLFDSFQSVDSRFTHSHAFRHERTEDCHHSRKRSGGKTGVSRHQNSLFHSQTRVFCPGETSSGTETLGER